MPWFWENFDHENYSIWYCEYMYPDELRLTFMSANLVGGMMQRLDKLRKYAFGSVAVFGSNNNSSISGVLTFSSKKTSSNVVQKCLKSNRCAVRHSCL